VLPLSVCLIRKILAMLMPISILPLTIPKLTKVLSTSTFHGNPLDAIRLSACASITSSLPERPFQI
jgi:hypothetical protein